MYFVCYTDIWQLSNGHLKLECNSSHTNPLICFLNTLAWELRLAFSSLWFMPGLSFQLPCGRNPFCPGLPTLSWVWYVRFKASFFVWRYFKFFSITFIFSIKLWQSSIYKLIIICVIVWHFFAIFLYKVDFNCLVLNTVVSGSLLIIEDVLDFLVFLLLPLGVARKVIQLDSQSSSTVRISQ